MMPAMAPASKPTFALVVDKAAETPPSLTACEGDRVAVTESAAFLEELEEVGLLVCDVADTGSGDSESNTTNEASAVGLEVGFRTGSVVLLVSVVDGSNDAVILLERDGDVVAVRVLLNGSDLEELTVREIDGSLVSVGVGDSV